MMSRFRNKYLLLSIIIWYQWLQKYLCYRYAIRRNLRIMLEVELHAWMPLGGLAVASSESSSLLFIGFIRGSFAISFWQWSRCIFSSRLAFYLIASMPQVMRPLLPMLFCGIRSSWDKWETCRASQMILSSHCTWAVNYSPRSNCCSDVPVSYWWF